MADQPFPVAGSDVMQIQEKIHKHRRRIFVGIVLVAALLALALAAWSLYLQRKTYTNYEVLSTAAREDTEGARFAVFGSNVIRYGKDGAVCMDMDNRIIWNQTYEMQEPFIDVCGSYAAISEIQGERIYIMDSEGPCGEIKTTMPIQRVKVANQGMVAVLMERGGAGYLRLYGKEGDFLAEGELHTANSGYPLDIAISKDGKKMAVSLLDVKSGSIKNSITFFNFDSVGQNEIDNIVGQYSYADVMFPKVEFLSNNVLAAFGDSKAVIFEGAQKPKVKSEIKLDKQVRSIFYDDSHVGFVFDTGRKKRPYRMEIYDLAGSPMMRKRFGIEYKEIAFLANDEVCVLGDKECAIYTLRGVLKFRSTFRQGIRKILPLRGIRDYVFLMDKETQKVRLK